MLALCLALAAVAAAGWAQSVVRSLPWASVGVFGLAALLFAIATRLHPPAPEALLPPPPDRSRASLRLLALGVVLAMGCGVAVYVGAPSVPTHLVWGAALAVLAAAALAGRGGDARLEREVGLPAPRRGWQAAI